MPAVVTFLHDMGPLFAILIILLLIISLRLYRSLQFEQLAVKNLNSRYYEHLDEIAELRDENQNLNSRMLSLKQRVRRMRKASRRSRRKEEV